MTEEANNVAYVPTKSAEKEVGVLWRTFALIIPSKPENPYLTMCLIQHKLRILDYEAKFCKKA